MAERKEQHNLQRKSQQFVQHLLDALFPPQCPGCKRRGFIICSDCLAQIQPISPPYCPHCHNPLHRSGICWSCYSSPLRLNGLRAASTYQEPLRACIHALKYKQNTRLSQPLGKLLAQTYRQNNLQADIILPVPLHPDRQRERGYNQAHLLAEQCAQELSLPLAPNILQRRRATPAQAHLSRVERQHNVTDAFICNKTLPPNVLGRRNILLIDDVSTTGATLQECAVPLFAAGASTVWGLVLARPS